MRIFYIALLISIISSVRAEDTGFICEIPGQFEEQKNLKVCHIRGAPRFQIRSFFEHRSKGGGVISMFKNFGANFV